MLGVKRYTSGYEEGVTKGKIKRVSGYEGMELREKVIREKGRGIGKEMQDGITE